ncbi:conserved hypothetical protein [Candidatus Terasakiella magnetica]|uniref:Uncharacterized protein n=1 Tax=Candidatus Terasakiella magnetica TaxID=1867952 RepID=A0A1C3RCC3_9PROT|nr:SAM-dependent chlorinase/fluorinase [Candidatus Terasakiella magnetica]SCA54898.1 conserved hypothetical protein [Candidatus Terasakiella magnetica]
MIFTFTDFGVLGPYLGQMKAAVLNVAPEEKVIDLMVDAPAFNIEASAQLLSGLLTNMGQGHVYLCVVDPGVGGTRKAICLKCDGSWFVGPDNGLFSQIISNAQEIESYEILWRPEVLSKSFHGRDLFAPVVAMISQNIEFKKQAIDRNNLTIFENIHKNCKVIYIDVYGNCWTGIKQSQCGMETCFIIGNEKVKYADVFCDTEEGGAFWYYNSSGFVEIAINQGSASKELKLDVGSQINRA